MTTIDADRRRIAVHCNQGAIFETDAAILTVSLPVLSEIALPAAAREKAAANATIPTWWTQHPTRHLVLTGWFAGPKADTVARSAASKLVEMGLASLAEIFDPSRDRIRGISSHHERSAGATTRSRATPIPTPRPKHAQRSRRWRGRMATPYSFR